VTLYQALIVSQFAQGQPPQFLSFNPVDSFYAFDAGLTGGVRVAFSDLNPSDPAADLVTSGGTRVRIWSGDSQSGRVTVEPLDDTFDAFPGFNGGIFVASGTT
jgi:hypothetical protein